MEGCQPRGRHCRSDGADPAGPFGQEPPPAEERRRRRAARCDVAREHSGDDHARAADRRRRECRAQVGSLPELRNRPTRSVAFAPRLCASVRRCVPMPPQNRHFAERGMLDALCTRREDESRVMPPRKVLVVDDSKLLHRMFEMMLRQYPLVHAYDGKEALQQLKENRDVDLVLLDMNMPKM